MLGLRVRRASVVDLAVHSTSSTGKLSPCHRAICSTSSPRMLDVAGDGGDHNRRRRRCFVPGRPVRGSGLLHRARVNGIGDRVGSCGRYSFAAGVAMGPGEIYLEVLEAGFQDVTGGTGQP